MVFQSVNFNSLVEFFLKLCCYRNCILSVMAYPIGSNYSGIPFLTKEREREREALSDY